MFHVLSVVLLALAWLVPNHYAPWSTVYSDAVAALALLFFSLANGRATVERAAPIAVWVVCAVALIPAAQWVTGVLDFSGDAFVSVLYIIAFASSISIGHAAANRNPGTAATHLALAVVLGALISSALAFNQALDVGGLGLWIANLPPGGRAFANLAQPNNLATLLGFGAIGLLTLREQRRLGSLSSALMLCVLVLAAGLTQSRVALLFAPIIACGVWVSSKRGCKFKTSPLAILVAGVGHWVVAWNWPTVQTTLLLDATAPLADRALQSARFHIWQILLDAVSRSAWQGYGWLQVGAAELAVAKDHPPVGEMWLHGHNVFLEFLIWCGVPLGLTLIGLVLYWFTTRAAKIRTKEAVAAFLSLCVLGAHALVELPHHYAFFLIPAGLWVGQIESSLKAFGPINAKWNLLPQALALTLTICVLKDYAAVEDDSRLLRFETFRIGELRAKEPAPDAPFLSTLTAFLRFSRMQPHSGMSATELNEAEAITKRYPYALSLSRYAEMLALNGRLPEAIGSFESIRHMYSPSTYANLRRELQHHIDDGQVGLTPLAQALSIR